MLSGIIKDGAGIECAIDKKQAVYSIMKVLMCAHKTSSAPQ